MRQKLISSAGTPEKGVCGPRRAENFASIPPNEGTWVPREGWGGGSRKKVASFSPEIKKLQHCPMGAVSFIADS